ncbi:STAS domain-containing protein [Streptomyces sp. NPDC001480]|uniref:STAS domain-containing protein n=1 Tax=Streptomyces sp. NPDC001480 TaxID=3364577 RepID=UPI003691FBDA
MPRSVGVEGTSGPCHRDVQCSSAVQLQEAADQVLADVSRSVLVVDCAALEFCDSSGIGCLMRLYQPLSARGGVLRLPPCLRLLRGSSR